MNRWAANDQDYLEEAARAWERDDEVQLPFEVTSLTSRDAAASMEGAAVSYREVVRLFIAARSIYVWNEPHGATADEVEAELGISGNTVRPRLRELAKAGLIVKAQTTRPTRSGRQAVVWLAA